MKNYLILICLCATLFACSADKVSPETQGLMGEWQFAQVRQGQRTDLCNDDVTDVFADKILEFTANAVVYVKDAVTKQVLLQGTWDLRTFPVYLNEDFTSTNELTTHFSQMLQNHDFSWTSVTFSSGTTWFELNSCANNKCYNYKFRKIE